MLCREQESRNWSNPKPEPAVSRLLTSARLPRLNTDRQGSFLPNCPPLPHQLQERGRIHENRASELALARGSSVSAPRVALKALKMEAKFFRQGFRPNGRPRVLTAIANAEKKKSYTCQNSCCSGSLHPLPLHQLQWAWVQVVERKIGIF